MIRERFSYYFKAIFTVFCFVFILDLLWRYASLTVFFNIQKIIQGSAGTVFGVFLFSTLLAAVFSLLERALVFFLRQKASQHVMQAIAVVFLSLALYSVFFTSLYRWLNTWQSILAADFQIISIFFIIPFLLAAIWFRKRTVELFFSSVPYHYFKKAVLIFIILILSGIMFKAAELVAPDHQADLPRNNNSVPNIIFITVDALSAKHMPLYGYYRNTTPRINKFAEESYVFERMHSNATTTVSGMASIFLSKYPREHGAAYPVTPIPANRRNKNVVYLLGRKLNPIALANSYALGRFFDYFGLLSHFKEVSPVLTDKSIIGFYWWYDFYFFKYLGVRTWLTEMLNDYFSDRFFVAFGTLSRFKPAIRSVTASSIFDSATKLNWESFSPVFLWLHVYAPHEAGKYSAPSPFRRKLSRNQLLVDRYDELLLYTDYYFGEFIDYLKNKKIYDNSIIILTADHGFHDNFSHEHLSETKIHIPLIIHLPGQIKGKRLSVLTEQIDLAPTMLELLGMPAPKWMGGESLVKYFKGGAASKIKYSMVGATIAVFKGDYKLVCDLENGKVSLYNLKYDSMEEHDLSQLNVKITANMRRIAEGEFKQE